MSQLLESKSLTEPPRPLATTIYLAVEWNGRCELNDIEWSRHFAERSLSLRYDPSLKDYNAEPDEYPPACERCGESAPCDAERRIIINHLFDTAQAVA